MLLTMDVFVSNLYKRIKQIESKLLACAKLMSYLALTDICFFLFLLPCFLFFTPFRIRLLLCLRTAHSMSMTTMSMTSMRSNTHMLLPTPTARAPSDGSLFTSLSENRKSFLENGEITIHLVSPSLHVIIF